MKRALLWCGILLLAGAAYWFVDGRQRYYEARAEEAIRRVEDACGSRLRILVEQEKLRAQAAFRELGHERRIMLDTVMRNRLKMLLCE